ncbi:MAG: PA14 domain-containing protein [Byssovorax sp.]
MKTENSGFEKQPEHRVAGALDAALMTLTARQQPIVVEETTTRRRHVIPSPEALRRVGEHLATRGIRSAASLVEMRLRGDDLTSIARDAGVEPDELQAIVNGVAETLAPAVREGLAREVVKPRATGQIDWHDPAVRADFAKRGIEPIVARSPAQISRLGLRDLISYLIPKGPKKSVDLRPFLGDARDQNPRGTCAVHGAVAVTEALEHLRDPRGGSLDLAEQFVWWYRGGGQRYSAGGYDGSAALDDIREVGVCEEVELPYQQVQINNNHTQVPIPDKAMDRAQFYRVGAPVGLPSGDVAAVKQILESGRCVLYASNLDGWNTGTGEIVMPPSGTTAGASHCTTIVGYIDVDGLAAELEGGYFIVRNSWGGAYSTTHIFGPEYGGHLLMPYGWYRQLTGYPATTTDRNEPSATHEWLVEYYNNPELRGAPVEHATLTLPFGSADISLPTTTADVDFNWGFHSPVQVSLLFAGLRDALPVDNFSVRFSKVLRLREGLYTFHLRGNDGLRLYVDDRLVINGWQLHASRELAATYHVTGGDHVVRVEYYAATGAAQVHFTVAPVNFHYELFHGAVGHGAPAAAFDDTLTELEWRHAPPVTPALGHSAGQFGLRGTASIPFEGGHYRFHAGHSGAFRLYVDGVLAYQDTGGATSSSDPVSISAGIHQIRVELENQSTVPTWGSHAYYKAFCRFGWSDAGWNATFYSNTRAKQLSDTQTLGQFVDSSYLFFRTCGLAGASRFSHTYPADPAGDLMFSAGSWNDFKTGVTGWPASFDLSFFGVHLRRRVFVPRAGYYNVELDANEGFRVTVDGKEIVQSLEFIGDDPYNGDIYLEAGVHDVSVEYNGTQWGGNLGLRIARVEWRVQYFAGKDLTGAATFDPALSTTLSTTVNHISEVPERGATLFSSGPFSARATRTVWMPVGKYTFAVKADDGVRLRVNQRTLVDAWVDEAPTDYQGSYEHPGGPMAISVDYYQAGGGKKLDLTVLNRDFYGEYYRGTTLNTVPPGSTLRRVAPIAYRYEGDIDFDLGQGSYLPRVGATSFSARWMGKVTLPVGRWSIEATSDDGVRVFIDGRLVIDSWKDQGATKHARQIDLTGRSHDVKVEYYQAAGRGLCQLQYVRVI